MQKGMEKGFVSRIETGLTSRRMATKVVIASLSKETVGIFVPDTLLAEKATWPM